MRWFRRAPVPEAPALEAVPETPRDRLLAAALRERFIITMQDDSAFDGLLIDVDERVLVLAQASTPNAGGARVMVDGALYLERSLVKYMQRPVGLPAPGTVG
jgi:hypothetical protein